MTDEQLRARFVTEIKKRNLFKNDVSEEWISANKDLVRPSLMIYRAFECVHDSDDVMLYRHVKDASKKALNVLLRSRA